MRVGFTYGNDGQNSARLVVVEKPPALDCFCSSLIDREIECVDFLSLLPEEGDRFARSRKNTMAKRIYVGGLPYSTSDTELTSLFAAIGTVNEASIITDRYTGRPKGFGFVEMENDAEAETAIQKLNGSVVGGRTLTVNEAKPREAQPQRDGGGGGGYRSNDREDRGRW